MEGRFFSNSPGSDRIWIQSNPDKSGQGGQAWSTSTAPKTTLKDYIIILSLIKIVNLRIGAAVSLAQAGASVVDMQVAGRWKSPQMPAYYARGELAEQGAIARLKYKR